jgi:hypothetical protein
MKLKNVSPFIAVSILGMLSIVLPIFILDNLKPYESPLFPLIRTGVEGISRYSFFLLFLAGFFVKIFSELPSWKIGLASMLLFPLAAICEIIAESSSHPMFAFEIILYSIISVPSIIGAYASQALKSILLKKKVFSSTKLNSERYYKPIRKSSRSF